MTEGRSRIVEISDFSLEGVQQFIEILYTGRSAVSSDLSNVLLLADKYQLPDVARLCVEKMLQTLSADTVVAYLAALTKASHLEECRAAKQKIIEQARAGTDASL